MPYILVGGGGAKMGYFWPFGANFGHFWPENQILGPKTGIFGILVGAKNSDFWQYIHQWTDVRSYS